MAIFFLSNRNVKSSMPAINDLLEVRKDGLTYQGLDLALFVPQYVVRKTNVKCKTMFSVHLTRRHPKIKIHVMALYLACKMKFLSLNIEPDEEFVRVRVDKNYYYYHKGKLRKENNKLRITRHRYLKIVESVNDYRGNVDRYYFVHASFIDNNNASYLGFSVQACTNNVTLHIATEAREQLERLYGGDYARLFRDFLFWIGYPKAVYISASKYKSLHNLMALQKEIKSSITEGTFT